MTEHREPLSINMSAISVAGVGGLGMIAVAAIIAVAFPIARWLLIGGIVGGVLLAMLLIVRGRSRRPGEPHGDLPLGLCSGSEARDAGVEATKEHHAPIDPELRRQLA